MAPLPNPAPLSPAVFAILLALAEGEKHGYAIMKAAAEESGGSLRMGPGTLYGSLDRMMRDALVEETGLTDDERRRYYRLTQAGAAALATETTRLANLVRAARRTKLLAQHAGAR